MKIDKICVYLIWSLFVLEPIFPAGQTKLIVNILTRHPPKFVSKILNHKNFMDYSARKLTKPVFTCLRARLNLKMRPFFPLNERIHCQRLNERPREISAILF